MRSLNVASRTITQITDDLDGSTEGVETVTFGLFGATLRST